MRNKILLAVATNLAFMASGLTCNAQDICAQLLAQGIRDTTSSRISDSRFNEIKSNVCKSDYDSYGKAAQRAMSGGFDLPGIFGISFGDATANSEYSKKWANFCKYDYGTAMSNTELSSYFSTANRSVLNSFDNCVNATSERFIRYVEPQVDGKTFAIVFNNRKSGNPSFEIIKISLTNSTTGQVMDVNNTCDFEHNLPWNTSPLNAVSIVCRKEPGDSIVVAGTTTAGNINPVVVLGVPEAPPQLVDRVAKLEGATLSLQNRLNSTAGSLDSLIIKETNDVSNLSGQVGGVGTRIDGLAKGGNSYIQQGDFNSGTETCPSGQVMVAIKQRIDAGFSRGITSWLGVICRSIN